jgi:D-3-phosphoglycerate dehydrogenase
MRILSLAPLSGPGLDILASFGSIEVDPWNEHVPIKLHSADELIRRLEGVDALIVEADHISREVIAGSSLRFLGVCRGDPNNVDLAAATEHGVVVIRTPGRNADAVADLTLGLILALLRSIVAADDDVRAGRWVVDDRIPQQRYLGRELASCTVGLVGLGAVGAAVARRLRALGAGMLAADPKVADDDMRALGVEPAADLTELLVRADVVSIHAPLNEATRGMIGARELAKVRPGSYLVNTARYGIVAEAPLLEALGDGRLAGAAFDHFEHEYLPAGHPLVSLPNVILTPHIGGTTTGAIEAHTRMIAEGIGDVLAGVASPYVVDPETISTT